MLKILLATDSDLLRPRLRMIIATIPHTEIVSDIADENEIASEVQRTDPDIVIVSFPRLGQSTTRLVPVIRVLKPEVKVIALNMAFSQVSEETWRRAGASYVFNLTLQLEQLIDCLTTFAQACLVERPPDSTDSLSSK